MNEAKNIKKLLNFWEASGFIDSRTSAELLNKYKNIAEKAKEKGKA